MTPSEIITADVQKHGENPEHVLRYINALIRRKNAVLMQANDSVLVLNRIGDGAVESHLFTQDAPLTLAKSLSDFIQRVRQSDIKAIYGKADNPQIIEMLRRLNVDVENSDKPKYNWMARV